VSGLLSVPSESIGEVLFFDSPRLPDVAAANRSYQAAEFEALLFAILFIASPSLAEHWSYALAGMSDDEIEYRRAEEYSQLSRETIETLFAMGNGEAWLCADFMAHRAGSGEVRVISNHTAHDSDTGPVALHINPARRIIAPDVRRTPAWVCDDSDLLAHALLAASKPRIRRNTSTSVPDKTTSLQTGAITIVAHCTDNAAAHLLTRAQLRNRRSQFVDLTYALSDECDDRNFERLRNLISEAPVVFARPLPARPSGIAKDLCSRRRLGTILRTLQARTAATLNLPGAGYTNLSKAAHLAFLSGLGLPVAPTVATNDPTAALEFIRTQRAVVYKSTSHARSVVSRFVTGDEERLKRVSKCPVLFQAYVDGPDYRVHTVAERALVTRIVSSTTDYRFAGQSAVHEAAMLPRSVTDGLISAAASSGLILSGADLKVSNSDDAWCVLEINRMPAFNFFDHRAGNAVADAVIDFASG
jgi:glutathione synthase/RimK-type ligase-like ATP-grasp enzyme